MPFVDSRLGAGTFHIGTPGNDFAAQISNIVLTPAVNSTDGTPTLATPEPAPLTQTDYTLDGSGIADFDEAAGLNRFLFDNDGVEQPFTWVTRTADGPTIAGNVICRSMPIGGAPGDAQIITDFSLPCVGKPTITDHAATARETAKAAK